MPCPHYAHWRNTLFVLICPCYIIKLKVNLISKWCPLSFGNGLYYTYSLISLFFFSRQTTIVHRSRSLALLYLSVRVSPNRPKAIILRRQLALETIHGKARQKTGEKLKRFGFRKESREDYYYFFVARNAFSFFVCFYHTFLHKWDKFCYSRKWYFVFNFTFGFLYKNFGIITCLVVILVTDTAWFHYTPLGNIIQNCKPTKNLTLLNVRRWHAVLINYFGLFLVNENVNVALRSRTRVSMLDGKGFRFYTLGIT